MPHKEEPTEKGEASDLWMGSDWQVPNNNVPWGGNRVARHDQALLEQDRTGKADWGTKCSTYASSLSYLEDCFKYLRLWIQLPAAFVCSDKSSYVQGLSRSDFNQTSGGECARDTDQNLPSISAGWMCACALNACVWACLCQNHCVTGNVRVRKHKRFLFKHHNLPWKHLNF